MRRSARPVRGPRGMDINELLMTAWRATAVYVLMLVVVRALGKRTADALAAGTSIPSAVIVIVPAPGESRP